VKLNDEFRKKQEEEEKKIGEYAKKKKHWKN